MTSSPRTGVFLLNFGEPEEPTLASVVPFLERIFSSNASLEGDRTPEAVQARSHELAVARAPGLIEEYEAIGASPLAEQARGQVDLLQALLDEMDFDARVYLGMQFTDPSIPEIVKQARDDGVERLVVLPVYPLCGRSTTVAALESVVDAAQELGWEAPVLEISGWHRHPDYIAMHADHIRSFLAERGVALEDEGTELVFSAHGTPVKYLDAGNRYDKYVDDFCALLARSLGVERFHLGFQNHGNRPIAWTQPDIEKVVKELPNRQLVVVAVSFMHEQSETLAELDIELREDAESVGSAFHRVPVPHDHERFIRVLGDLVLARSATSDGSAPPAAVGLNLVPCLCRNEKGTHCLNGAGFAVGEVS